MQRDLYVLLDANLIIEAYERKVWAGLTAQTKLVVPSVVRQEAQFYFDPDTGNKERINLAPDIDAGRIREVTASAEQIGRLLDQFDPVFSQRIDSGEREALALLLDGVLPDHLFSTADGPAIRALCLLGMFEIGISFETLLQRVGLGRTLQTPFTEAFFKDMLQRGKEEHILGVGLRPTKKEQPTGKKRKRF